MLSAWLANDDGLMLHSGLESSVVVQPDRAHSPSDVDRFAAVRRYEILDTPPDGSFDRITTLAARILQVPIAMITIVDRNRIWFKSRFGKLDIWQTPREPGLCATAICQKEPYIVEKARTNCRTRNNSLVSGKLGIQFYAAAPLRTHDGFNLGTLCILDDQPRQLARSEVIILESLAAIVVDELELRLNRRMVASERALRERATKLASANAHRYQQRAMPPHCFKMPCCRGLFPRWIGCSSTASTSPPRATYSWAATGTMFWRSTKNGFSSP